MQAFVPDNTITGTGGADGYLTVSTNVGFYPGAFGNLMKADKSGAQRVIITELLGGTKIGIRFVPEGIDDPKLRTGVVKYPHYGRTDISAYTAGAILYTEAQTVSVYQPMFDPQIKAY